MLKTRRANPRRAIAPLQVSTISSMENLVKIAKGGFLIEASITGFLMMLKREDLVPASLRNNLVLDEIVGMKILIHLPQMNLEIYGEIVRTRLVGKKEGFEIAIDYTEDSPEYWRECLLDLLPSPGELEGH